jgi:hypothetical protein
MMEKLEGVQEPLRSIAIQIIQASGGRIGLTSGYRDNAHQQRLWQEALAKYGDPEVADNWVARPGTSHHEKGMAIDFSGDMDLLSQLAPQHGLFQPMDHEPWHWELGDGADYEGQPNLDFDMLDSPAANPEDVLANRMNAIMSIIGGNNDGGDVAPMNQMDMWGAADEIAGEFEMEDALRSGISVASQGAGEAATALGAGGAGQYQKYALKVMQQKYGWDASELNALIELWNRESNWNPEADNPTSSAAGIAQKMTSIHGPIEPTAEGQINWGLEYIAGRYGSPSAALQWHNRNNWY